MDIVIVSKKFWFYFLVLLILSTKVEVNSKGKGCNEHGNKPGCNTSSTTRTTAAPSTTSKANSTTSVKTSTSMTQSEHPTDSTYTYSISTDQSTITELPEETSVSATEATTSVTVSQAPSVNGTVIRETTLPDTSSATQPSVTDGARKTAQGQMATITIVATSVASGLVAVSAVILVVMCMRRRKRSGKHRTNKPKAVFENKAYESQAAQKHNSESRNNQVNYIEPTDAMDTGYVDIDLTTPSHLTPSSDYDHASTVKVSVTTDGHCGNEHGGNASSRNEYSHITPNGKFLSYPKDTSYSHLGAFNAHKGNSSGTSMGDIECSYDHLNIDPQSPSFLPSNCATTDADYSHIPVKGNISAETGVCNLQYPDDDTYNHISNGISKETKRSEFTPSNKDYSYARLPETQLNRHGHEDANRLTEAHEYFVLEKEF